MSGLEASSELLNSKRMLLVPLADDSTLRADSAIGLHWRPRKCCPDFGCVGVDGGDDDNLGVAPLAASAVADVPTLLPKETSKGDGCSVVVVGAGDPFPLLEGFRRRRKLRTRFLMSDRSAKLPFSGRTIRSRSR